ncbi:glycosyltransferase family 2 protein [Alteromonas mediterranea]|uniref:glycosyltransferase family 2 protein n=1 Tax=Alteromonas mediterranea TaxID=314275 RepID=UPI0011303F9C|nr:glycosyltransferase family 2 protein [Alteromonas mediterranea]QDG39187.1 glycosyltransferase family 2 protein [Alteromonas mediterranea]
MKLIIQIPCYNEEHTLPQTVKDLPTHIEGIDVIEYMIIDDGSKDNTVEVAKSLGVHHIVRNKNNRGLARTFRKGIDECLKRGADIIVNTDGDNQYAGWDVAKLVVPILEGKADVVVGDRKTQDIEHFSPLKKLLQKVGSYVVKKVSGVEVPDAVSGFRAYSREAVLQLNIISPFSYTIEALIQSGKKHMAVTHVPVETNAKTRESRLFTSIPKFIERQLTTIVRMYTMYQPLRVFVLIGALITLVGLIPIIRFLIFYMMGDGNGHLQSLILGGVLTVLGIITFLIAILADLINFNRQLIEQTLEKVRRMELQMLDEKKERESARNDSVK